MSTSTKTKKLQLLGGFAKKTDVDKLSEAISDKQPKTLVVNIEEVDDGYEADKTYDEIVQHIENGIIVQVMYDGLLYVYDSHDIGRCVFTRKIILEHIASTETFSIDADDNKVHYHVMAYDPAAIPLPPTAQVGQMFRASEVDKNGMVTMVEAVDVYTKPEIDTMFGSYVNDIAELIGGEAIADS